MINELNETYTQSSKPQNEGTYQQEEQYDNVEESSEIDIEMLKNELMERDDEEVKKIMKRKNQRNCTDGKPAAKTEVTLLI